MTQYYIGSKQVMGWPEDRNGMPGYSVRYPDGYSSWSPKSTFEAAYYPMGEASDGDVLNDKMVEDFIMHHDVQTIGEKTTLVRATLINGFEIIETSSCVDKTNYDEAVGERICLGRVKTKVYELLGFTLQWAHTGLT